MSWNLYAITTNRENSWLEIIKIKRIAAIISRNSISFSMYKFIIGFCFIHRQVGIVTLHNDTFPIRRFQELLLTQFALLR